MSIFDNIIQDVTNARLHDEMLKMKLEILTYKMKFEIVKAENDALRLETDKLNAEKEALKLKIRTENGFTDQNLFQMKP